MPFDQLQRDLNILKDLLDNNKVESVKNLLSKLIKLYKSNSEIVDHIHTEQSSVNKLAQKLALAKNKGGKVIKIK